MHDDFGLTVEAVMRMPWCRFMALQKLQQRQHIEARNQAARDKWRSDNEASREI